MGGSVNTRARRSLFKQPLLGEEFHRELRKPVKGEKEPENRCTDYARDGWNTAFEFKWSCRGVSVGEKGVKQ